MRRAYEECQLAARSMPIAQEVATAYGSSSDDEDPMDRVD